MLRTRDVLTPQQVAEYLQLTPDTVYRYIREGKLVASRIGRQYRIRRESVELFLLATSTAGDARMRTFSREQVEEMVEFRQCVDQAFLHGGHWPAAPPVAPLLRREGSVRWPSCAGGT